MLRCLILINIINDRSVLESAEKFRENGKDERKIIIWEIFYVVCVRMSGKILEDRKVGRYETGGNTSHSFFWFSRNNHIKAISVKVQAITQVFSEPSNHEPKTPRLWTQTRFVTPLSCDIEPDINKPTSKNIFVSADLDTDLDPVQAITQVFSKPSNHDPQTPHLRNQTQLVIPLSWDLEPDITNPDFSNIVV